MQISYTIVEKHLRTESNGVSCRVIRFCWYE